MLVIPAIDLKDGKCVRLRQGEMDDATVYDAPVIAAAKWVESGATRLHIVDLDGAFAGKPVNAGVIEEITSKYPNLDVQVGGGIRDEETIQSYLNAGVRYVIIGTKAISTPHFVEDMCAEFPGHIIVGLDAKNGKVATDGWSKLSNHDVIDMAQRFESMGVEAIIYTDIGRDGMLTGVNIEATVKLAQSIRIPVVASGGVTNMGDIEALCEVEGEGVMGAITGRAIYEGSLDFVEAREFSENYASKNGVAK